MKEALRAHLLADAGVSALVGTRIAWGGRPRGSAMPSVALHLIDGQRDYAMQAPTGLVRARVQADCWALTYADATSTSRAVLAALSGLRQTVAGVQFQGIFAIDQRDLSEDGTGADEVFYRESLDFEIWHSE